MSTLTRTNSTNNNRRPQYKDYVSFLESYKTGKKDDQRSVATSDSGVNFSLTNSPNSSSGSLFSDVVDNKRHTVNLPVPKPIKSTVKTEVFIEIKNQPDTRTFEVEKGQLSVSSAAKMFENIRLDPAPKPKNYIGEISKVFEDPPAHKVTLKKANSISEVSKVFQNGSSKPKNFNTTPKPFQVKVPVNQPPQKPAITSPKPIIIDSHHYPKSPSTVSSSVSSLSTSPSPPQSLSPPPPAVPCPSPSPPVAASPPPPPPPPLPPADFGSKSARQNGTALGAKMSSQDRVDGQKGIDKNDPRVKRMVYGALRNMYGAYHDKANDYIATLPKNRVRKNNGLDSIIDSIASQGGLEKLTGRTNPNAENE